MSRFSLVLAALAVAGHCARAGAGQCRWRLLRHSATTNIWAGVYTDQQAAQGQTILSPPPVRNAMASSWRAIQTKASRRWPPPASWWNGTARPWPTWCATSIPGPTTIRGDMDPFTAVALAAFILNRNGVPSGKTPLSTDAKEEAKILFTKDKPK